MERRFEDCLQNKEESYLLPFLWMHGEDHLTMSRELDAIEQCGIREFCAESRTHPDFCEEKWWEDFGFLLKEAKRRGMRVWLLDDKRFPTGYANGYYSTHPREHKYRWLKEIARDVSGPDEYGMLLVPNCEGEAELYAVLAYKRTGNGEEIEGEPIDLTPFAEDGLVKFSIPDGVWRVFFYFRTDKGGNGGWIDCLWEESCHAMISQVYQPQYDHFSEYFGNTFAGFFSDEPGFANGGSYYYKLGTDGVILPWRDDMISLIAAEAKISEAEAFALLPALWHSMGEKQALIRSYYMEVITKLYSKNIGWQLGNWCREHKVLYIGHVIEDMNAHMRTGYGAGHYYRALDGQDMAGIDVVLDQIMPGQQEMAVRAPFFGEVGDPSFFQYTLAKLASSHSHIQPLKKNRAMCEIFGAFGWAEGTQYMRFLADHMFVNGINYYVPHAFDPKYPDKDCPPHFYAGGANPLFEAFGILSRYMQRMSHVLSGGVHVAQVAVFYNAEGEWSGGKNMLFQEVAKELTQHQIDFDFVPRDYLSNAQVRNGRMYLNEESYGALILSESEVLPLPLLQQLADLARQGLPVYFVNSLPCRASEYSASIAEYLPLFQTVALQQLSAELREKNMAEIIPAEDTPYLVYYHIQRDGKDIFMLRNSDIHHDIHTELTLPVTGDFVAYDGWSNRLYGGKAEDYRLSLHLRASDSIVLCFGEKAEGLPAYEPERKCYPLSLTWNIFTQETGKEKQFYKTTAQLTSLTHERKYSRFAGEMEYVAHWKASGKEALLDLGRVGETAHVIINGMDCGYRICPPYRFAIAQAVREGENEIRIFVRNHAGYRERDDLSSYYTMSPSGILGPITIEK